MNTNKELHLGILSSILSGRITPEKTIEKAYVDENESCKGFQSICISLHILGFRENLVLNLATPNVRVFEKAQWPYLVTVSCQSSAVTVALTDKIKLVAELISTL